MIPFGLVVSVLLVVCAQLACWLTRVPTLRIASAATGVGRLGGLLAGVGCGGALADLLAWAFRDGMHPPAAPVGILAHVAAILAGAVVSEGVLGLRS